jgi:hypothetical protein
MTNSLQSSEITRDSFNDTKSYHQTELPLIIEESSEPAMSVISSKLDQHQQSLEELIGGFIEIVNVLHEQQESNPTEDIKAVKQKVDAMEQGMMKIYHYLKEDSLGKELKAGQQSLQRGMASLTSSAIEAKQKKTTYNLGYLDWKQIATIITAAAIVSSLCSLAVVQLASSLKTDQKIPIPIEKPLKATIKKPNK